MNNKNEKSPEGEKRSEINIVSQQIAENNYSGINETTKNNNNISRESSVTYSTVREKENIFYGNPLYKIPPILATPLFKRRLLKLEYLGEQEILLI